MGLPQEKIFYETDKYYTPEEYLKFEREVEERHEYLDGFVFEMAGESLAHGQISVNIIGEMRALLRKTPCQVLSPNMKVHIRSRSMFAYPDVTVVCGQMVFHDSQRDVLVNPRVIFEVLSPATEKYDRGEKFFRYQNELESLTDYILVSQDKPLIEQYARQENGGWLYLVTFGLESVLRIASLNVELSFFGIYDRIEFSEEALHTFDAHDES